VHRLAPLVVIGFSVAKSIADAHSVSMGLTPHGVNTPYCG